MVNRIIRSKLNRWNILLIYFHGCDDKSNMETKWVVNMEQMWFGKFSTLAETKFTRIFVTRWGEITPSNLALCKVFQPWHRINIMQMPLPIVQTPHGNYLFNHIVSWQMLRARCLITLSMYFEPIESSP